MITPTWYYSPWPSADDPAEPSSQVAPPAIAFNPLVPAPDEDHADPIRIYRGSGLPIARFVPSAPFAAIAAEWRVRLGSRTTTILEFTAGAGLIVDEAVGIITANPSAAQTSGLPLDRPLWLELWRIGTGDDRTVPIVRRRAIAVSTLG